MRSKTLQINAALRCLGIVVTFLIAQSLLVAQTFTLGDTLKYTVHAEKVATNTTVIRLIPQNETSLFWANQQNLVVRRYTLTINGMNLDDNQILASRVDIPLNSKGMIWMQQSASTTGSPFYAALSDVIFEPDVNLVITASSIVSNDFFIDTNSPTRLGIANAIMSEKYEYAEAAGLACIDPNASEEETYVYFVGSEVPTSEIQGVHGLWGMEDENEAFRGYWYEWFLFFPRELTWINPPKSYFFFGHASECVVRENDKLTIPSPKLIKEGDYVIKLKRNSDALKKYYSEIRLEKLNTTSNQWEMVNRVHSGYEDYIFTVKSSNYGSYRLKATASFYEGLASDIINYSNIIQIPPPTTNANDGSEKIEVAPRAIYKNNKVYLRWEPSNIRTWELGNINGYKVMRYTKSLNGTALSQTAIDNSKIEIPTFVKARQDMINSGYPEMNYAAMAVYDPKNLIDTTSIKDPITKAFAFAEMKENARVTAIGIANSDFLFSDYLGLGYIDFNTQTNAEYQYVVAVNSLDTIENRDASYNSVTINTSAPSNLGTINNLRVDPDDKYIMLKWDKPTDVTFDYYNIYRRVKGQIPFQKTNVYPYVFSDPSSNPDVFYADSLANNTTIYEYYVEGMTNFGIMGNPSALIEVKGKPRPVPTKPFIEKIEEQTKGKLLITWSLPQEFSSKIQGYYIRRAEDRDLPFVNINPNIIPNTLLSASGFTYLDLFPLPTAYYMIVAIDENGYELLSVPKMAQIEDDTPPAQPSGISGTVDLDGFAQVSWTENTEPDLLGYRVFFSNNQDGDFIPVTDKWETEANFTKYVNIETLAEEIWVKIVAIDYHHNQSIMSLPYRLNLPDITPPSEPLLVYVKDKEQCVEIKWYPSSSSDVIKHEVQRRPLLYAGDWETIFETDKKDTLHCDGALVCWMDYEYRIKATDDVTLSSYSNKGVGSKISDHCYQAVYNPKVIFTQQIPTPNKSTALRTKNGFICIYWEFPCDYPVEEYHIYRRMSKTSPYVLVKSIRPQKAIFTSYFTIPDPNNPGKDITYGFPNSLNTNKTSGPAVLDSNPPTGNNNQTISTPKKTKTISDQLCAYLVEDDDITLLSFGVDNAEYIIQAEFKDGTRSQFTDPMKPKK